MIRVALAFMLISGSAFAQTAVQGTSQYKMQPCHDEGNLTVCDMGTLKQINPIYSEIGQNDVFGLNNANAFAPTVIAACAALTPSGKCVQIKVDEDGRVIVSPDEKSDAYTAGYQKGYIMGFKNGKETK